VVYYINTYQKHQVTQVKKITTDNRCETAFPRRVYIIHRAKATMERC